MLFMASPGAEARDTKKDNPSIGSSQMGEVAPFMSAKDTSSGRGRLLLTTGIALSEEVSYL